MEHDWKSCETNWFWLFDCLIVQQSPICADHFDNNDVIRESFFRFRNLQPYAEMPGETVEADQEDESSPAPIQS